MQRSGGRILTTHTGSLPRTGSLKQLLVDRQVGREVDAAQLDREVRTAVDRAVAFQAENGIDVGNDGEQGRFLYSTYTSDRMSGFGGVTQRPAIVEFEVFPEWAALWAERYLAEEADVERLTVPAVVGELRYDDELTLIREETSRLRDALTRAGDPFVASFMNAASPGIVAALHGNEHYETHDAYLSAIAREMHKEYKHVTDQGFLLQLDSPDFAAERLVHFRDGSLSDYLKIMESHVETVNRALEGIPPEQVRLHVCWGNYPGPHVHDIEIPDLLPLLYRLNVGALVLPLANPRHQHEIEAFAAQPPPDHMSLVVGVIDVTTDFVEHPHLVRDRLVRAGRAIGDPTRVLAGTDCGFSTGATTQWLANEVIAMKLRSLREGADLASEVLW